MALTVTVNGPVIPLPYTKGAKILDVTIVPNAYATGGIAVTPSAFGLNQVDDMYPVRCNTAAALYAWRYDSEAGTLVGETAGAQVADEADLAALEVGFWIRGC